MNVNTGQTYLSMAEAYADLGPTETTADVVSIQGDPAAVASLTRSIQTAHAAERRHSANKRARKTRQRNRRP